MPKHHKSYVYVKRWRHKTKQRIVDAFGGECGVCGYKRYIGALQLHHLKPGEKEYTFGNLICNAIAWEKIVTELRKCALVCSICHIEHHGAGVAIPPDIKRFDESYVNYIQDEFYDDCPICGKKKTRRNITCSHKCKSQLKRRKWPAVDVLEKLVWKLPATKIATKFGVSGKMVEKWCKAYGIDKPGPGYWSKKRSKTMPG